MSLKKVAVSLGFTKVPIEFSTQNGQSDLNALKGAFINYCEINNSLLHSFSGGQVPKMEHLILMKSDDDLGCEVAVGQNEEIKHLQKDLIMNYKAPISVESKLNVLLVTVLLFTHYFIVSDRAVHTTSSSFNPTYHELGKLDGKFKLCVIYKEAQ